MSTFSKRDAKIYNKFRTAFQWIACNIFFGTYIRLMYNFNVEGNVSTSGTFDSNGALNTVSKNFTQQGDSSNSTFAAQTTTTINGTFNCLAGTFEREGLDGGTNYRATVNVGVLGKTEGTTTTAWPTEMHNN